MRIKDLFRINSNKYYTKEEILKYREIYAKDEEIYIAVIVPVTAFVVSMLIANISYFVNSITEHPYALFGCGSKRISYVVML